VRKQSGRVRSYAGDEKNYARMRYRDKKMLAGRGNIN
jgi:hypothetical protein